MSWVAMGLLPWVAMDTNNGHPVHCVRQTEVDFSDQLSEAIREKQLQRDEVVRIINTRSKSQLRATFQQYKEDRGTDIGKVRSDY